MHPVAMELYQDGQIAIQEEKLFKCSICENEFAKIEELAKHISSVHEEKKPQNESMEKLFKCSICEDEFAKIEELAQHISSVHEEKNPIDWMVMPHKGQLISKCLFVIFNSPNKRTKKFDLTTMAPNCFCSFFGRIEDTKKHFEINRHLIT